MVIYESSDVMYNYSKIELEEALQVISAIISRCENIQQKFAEGTSQHTLLKNRIKAMNISKLLITGEEAINQYTTQEVIEALRPVSSIISKCRKAQLKFAEGTFHHTRFKTIIEAMSISLSLIDGEIGKRKLGR